MISVITRRSVLAEMGTERWRAFFDILADGEESVELRCFLRLGEEVLTETWVYRYFPA